MKKVVVVTLVFALVLITGVIIGLASPASGVTPTVLARGTFGPFHLNTDSQSLVDFQAKAKSDLDVVVRQHEYAPQSTTGWHTHPGPVFITVTKGTLTFYEYDDPTCSAKIVDAGHGYVDTGRGHIGLNETDEIAQDISVIVAPVEMGFRSELAAPGPYWGF